MTTIDDPRFLRQFSRRFCCRSVSGRANARVLAGRRIEVHRVHDYDGDDLEIRIVDAQGTLVGLLWSENEAYVVDDHTVAGVLADDYDDDALTKLVRLFVRRHRLTNTAAKKDVA